MKYSKHINGLHYNNHEEYGRINYKNHENIMVIISKPMLGLVKTEEGIDYVPSWFLNKCSTKNAVIVLSPDAYHNGIKFVDGVWRSGHFKAGQFCGGVWLNGTFGSRAYWENGLWVRGKVSFTDILTGSKKQLNAYGWSVNNPNKKSYPNNWMNNSLVNKMPICEGDYGND